VSCLGESQALVYTASPLFSSFARHLGIGTCKRIVGVSTHWCQSHLPLHPICLLYLDVSIWDSTLHRLYVVFFYVPLSLNPHIAPCSSIVILSRCLKSFGFQIQHARSALGCLRISTPPLARHFHVLNQRWRINTFALRSLPFNTFFYCCCPPPSVKFNCGYQLSVPVLAFSSARLLFWSDRIGR
jgi:hypothetical protein